MNHSPNHPNQPATPNERPLPSRRGLFSGKVFIPAALVISISALAQAPGFKFRGNLPTPLPAAVPNTSAPVSVELPEPAPVLPGSRIIDPRLSTPAKPALPETAPVENERPVLRLPRLEPKPQPTVNVPADEPEEPRVTKRTQRVHRTHAESKSSKSIQPPEMPATDVPQIESANLFPTAKQQMELAATQQERGWDLIIHGGLRATWDSNIYIQERDEESDLIFTFSPGIAVGWGEFRSAFEHSGEFRDRLDLPETERAQSYFFLDYTPSYHLYTNNSSESSLEHDVRIAARHTFTKLTLAANARFQTLNETDSDIGGRVEWRAFDASTGADFALNAVTTLETSLDYSRRDFEDTRNDIAETRATVWLDRQVSPTTNVALGYTHGWVDVDSGANQDFDQAQLRVVWKATDKLSARATGGVEWRSIDNREDSTEATFAVGLVYNPFDATSIFLNGFRRTSTSAAGLNELITSTGFDARVVQRLGDKYYLTGAAGFQTADYDENAITGFGREDDYTWGRLSLGWDVNEWLTAVVAYEYRDNDSNQFNRSYQEHLLFLQFSVLF